MYALANTLNDPRGAARGLAGARRGPIQGLPGARPGLSRGTPIPTRFRPHSTVLDNHGRRASIHAVERPSMPIDDSHPPLPKGSNGGNLPRSTSEFDRLVYKLYGLQDERIWTVEAAPIGSASPAKV
jgi:hypothetical protein